MNSRERFLETMRFGHPDHVPLFEEGIRDSVLLHWKELGWRNSTDFQRILRYDRREEIETNLEPSFKLAESEGEEKDLVRLRNDLNADDPSRLPETWDKLVYNWRQRKDVLLLRVHRGFFLTLGVYHWRDFEKVIFWLSDKPDFVHQALTMQGEFAARIADRILGEIQIDGAIFSEPIGGNHGPLISPRMYETFMLPSYQPLFEVLRRHGVENLIYRTYANARSLLPLALKMGINCLWAVERNSQAMDYFDIRREFGKELRLIGGIDRDALRFGEDAISRELENKAQPLLEEGGFIPLADGRIREDISFENYLFYRRLLEKITGR